MHTALEQNAPPGSLSEDEKEKVREQMNRLLETHHFKNSRRYPALLRFIVEETLEGRGEFLKERLLGVRVFNRPTDYDTAADPVVRVTIAEIRKRIAQYYHDEEHDAEIRIELLPGRYAPEFRARRDALASHPDPSQASAQFPPGILEPEISVVPESRPKLRSRAGYTGVAMIVLILAAIVISAIRWIRPSALDELWSPILSTKRPILFCLPTDVGKKILDPGARSPVPGEPTASGAVAAAGQPANSSRSFLAYETLGENVVYSDMLATLNIVDVLAAHHSDYRVRLTNATTLEDLRHGPAILIGGLDNPWTMRALAPLPYHLTGTDEDRYWIADARDPGDKHWSLDLKETYTTVIRDYAIIARLHNEQTGEPEMIVAGIGMSGTAAAGEFIGNEDRMKEMRQRVGSGFKDRDFEVVLSTDVVNGSAGSAKILAVSVW
jgi:hypothetical protein